MKQEPILDLCDECSRNKKIVDINKDMMSIIVIDNNGTVHQINYCPCYEKKYRAFINLFKAMGSMK